MNQSQYDPLFNHMADEHGLTLVDSEMQEIVHIVTPIVLQWVPVSERLPELNEPLMGYDDNGRDRVVIIDNYKATVWAFDPEIGQFKAEYTARGWREISSRSSNGNVNVTHWMPLPKSPTL